jgi:hypothetical protein
LLFFFLLVFSSNPLPFFLLVFHYNPFFLLSNFTLRVKILEEKKKEITKKKKRKEITLEDKKYKNKQEYIII